MLKKISKIVKNDLILKMTPEHRSKTFHNLQFEDLQLRTCNSKRNEMEQEMLAQLETDEHLKSLKKHKQNGMQEDDDFLEYDTTTEAKN